jgi:hypothetical protein
MSTTNPTKKIETIKSLRYGVELETVGISETAAVAAIVSVLGPTATVSANTSYLGGYKVTMSDGRSWAVVRDASLSDHSGKACEIVSPILTWSDMETVQAIARALRTVGGRVNSSCGMHVHVDGAAFKANPSKVKNLIGLAHHWEDVAVNMASVIESRLVYCKTLEADLVERFRGRSIRTLDAAARAWYGTRTVEPRRHYDSSRYHWINVHSLFDKGTIEFRLFNGTLHAGQVKANILFALGFATAALSVQFVLFNGVTGTRTLANGRRAVTECDAKAFVASVLGLTGPEFKNYREHLVRAISGETVAE